MNYDPIFIGGQMKSGTTMLRALIGQHDYIYGGLETHWFNIDGNINNKNTIITKLALFYELDTFELEKIFLNYKNSNTHFIDSFLKYNTLKNNKRRWVEKTPQNISHIDLINEYWDNYKFIHVLRDFRDIYASWKMSNKGDVNFFIESVKSSYVNLEKYRSNPNYFEIKYEELVINPKESISEILVFLRENIDTKCFEINTKVSKIEFDKVKNITGKESNTLKSTQKKIFSSKISQYKEILTNEEINIIEFELELYFKLFGYKI